MEKSIFSKAESFLIKWETPKKKKFQKQNACHFLNVRWPTIKNRKTLLHVLYADGCDRDVKSGVFENLYFFLAFFLSFFFFPPFWNRKKKKIVLF